MSPPTPGPSPAPTGSAAGQDPDLRTESAPAHRTVLDRLGVSPAQVAGGALAAVTAAVAASFFGVTGTLLGAAFGSIVSSIGAAVYSASLSTAAARGVAVTRTLVVRPAPGTSRQPAGDDPTALPPELAGTAVPQPADVGAADVPTNDAPGTPATAVPGQLRRRIAVKPLLVLAGVVFAIAVGVVTLAEAVLGHPVSSTGGGGTSVGRLISGDVSSDPGPGVQETADPTASPSPSTSGSAGTQSPSPGSPEGGNPTAEPSGDGPGQGGPTASPSTTPSAGDPGTTPTGAPTPSASVPAAPGGSSGAPVP